MTATSPTPRTASRPRHRRQLVVEAAGRTFTARGYHAASMEEIAAGAGITAAALYRHFPNKYALFVTCVNVLVDGLVDVLGELPDEASLEEVLGALTEVTMEHRDASGVHRWEARYLEPADSSALARKFALVVDRVTAGVQREHPGAEAALRATAALGAIGSITMHHTALARRRAERLLVDAALRVTSTDLDLGTPTAAAPEIPATPAVRTRRAQILAAAIPLFARSGFANVTIGDIAREVGVAPSAIYRHYAGKVDILAAACLQAAALLEQSVTQALLGAASEHDAVVALARTYAAYSFEHRALTGVAEAEIVGLPETLRRPLIVAQREHIAVWEDHLRGARPELDARAARVLVHAGFGVVVEGGRRLRWRDTPEHRELLAELLVRALGVTA